MAEGQPASAAPSTFPNATAFNSMTDLQLRQTISQLSSYASPQPQTVQQRQAYMKNLHTWSTTSTPASRSPAPGARSSRSRTTRSSNLAPTTPQPQPQQYVPPVPMYQQPIQHVPIVPVGPPNPPKPPLPTTTQAVYSTYSSRLRTGATLLVQPILATTTAAGTRATGRRGGIINYADPGSGDDLPDAGAIDSDDSDFADKSRASRASRSRQPGAISAYSTAPGVSATPQAIQPPRPEKTEVEQSYLGLIPPARFIKARRMPATAHVYPTQDMMEEHASKRSSLIPIRVEFETDTHRIRDCFVWNINEALIKPEIFARTFCNDLELNPEMWAETIANQIRAQIEEHEGVASMDLGQDGAYPLGALPTAEELPECRVILSIDVQIANYHLMDHIEWDLLSPLTPEEFAKTVCKDIGLGGEAIPLVAHAVHEELMKHKKDAVEWGVIGGDNAAVEEAATGIGAAAPKDRSAQGFLKDKTGLGLGWGRAPKDGRGPKTLRSVWRDWAEAEEFRTKFEVLTAEEVERREIERERASRRLRRETSKFQTTRSTRYRVRY